jgi:FtsP/CotA-like multicopper oxidase with cupredoxin domain
MDTTFEATHPVHFHVNHFQIVAEYIRNSDECYTTPDSANINSLYRIGEFRDTVQVFPNRVLPIRTSTYGFSGTMTLHCHYLMHADTGMMSLILLNDGDGNQTLTDSEGSELEL